VRDKISYTYKTTCRIIMLEACAVRAIVSVRLPFRICAYFSISSGVVLELQMCKMFTANLTFVFPCINSVITIDNQQYATVLIYLLPISSTCFGRCFRPSSGAYHCNYSCPPMLLLAGVAYHGTPASGPIGSHYQKL